MIWFFAKLMLFLFGLVWVRATLPRFRYDQLMDLGWKLLIPLALGWFLLLAGLRVGDERNWSGAQTAGFVVGFMAVCLVLSSLLMAAISSARDDRLERERAE